LYKLSNPFIFWAIVLFMLVAILFSQQTHNDDYNNKQQHIKEMSYNTISDKNDRYILDLNKINDATNIKDIEVKDMSFITKVSQISISNIWLILYTLVLSILFLIRERDNKVKTLINEKLQDRLRIEDIKKKSHIEPDLINGLKLFSNILKPDIDVEKLEQKINTESKYILIAIRVVLERLLQEIDNQRTSDEITLNSLIYQLHKSKKITNSMLNYAHIIKAFGNKAVHPNIKKPVNFTKQEVLMVLSVLLLFLKECEEKKIMDIKNV